MSGDARDLIRSVRTQQQLAIFASRLRTWLLTTVVEAHHEVHDFPESRARALLRASAMVDDATLSDFARLVTGANGLRVALHDLLLGSELASHDEVQALAAVASRTAASETPEVGWLSLALSGYAWKRGYAIAQLDPASPPERFSPAGQVVANTGAFLRQQIQRGTTERERLARRLQPRDGDASATLDDLRAEGSIPPLPPHFRAPIPVRYPEIARDTLRVEPEPEADERPVSRGDSLVITEEDLSTGAREQQGPPEPGEPLRMPPLQISRDQVQPSLPPSPLPPSAVVMPANSSDSRPGLTVAIRQMFGPEALSSTKLRVIAQAYPDGPGMYGLQVKVTCKGIKSFVAGTTDRDGRFLAELPAKRQEGLTYDVDLTWPREMGGETERKSMTLHADRTEFILPFYRRLEPRVETDEQRAG